MGIVDLKKDSLVYYKNEQYKIFKIINFNEVSIEHLKTKEIVDVLMNELSSCISIENKNYIDNYSDEEWLIANKRYEIIKDLVFIKRSKSQVNEVGQNNGYSGRTIYKWINLYEQTNLVSSLVPSTSNRGSKSLRIDSKVEYIVSEILDDLYLNKQRFSFRKIYNRIYQECKKNNLVAPHENTIRNRIQDIDPEIATKRRIGYKESKEKYSNFEGEFPEGNYPLEFVQIDHTPLDIIVVDKIHRLALGRPYLTLAIDVYSRMIAGIYVSLQAPGYFNVSQCLFNIFTKKDKFLLKNNVVGDWNINGIPRIIGVDNGADLVSSDMQRVCDEFGITLMKRPVSRPQFGAHVERVLGTINKEIHNLPGSTKSNIFEKGNYDAAKEALYTIEDLSQWIVKFIVNIYHKKYHYGISMTPEEKYIKGTFGDDENPGTGLPPILDNLEYVKIALLPTEFRTVQKDGITLDGITYYSDVLRHWIARVDSKKSKIKHKIKRDPLNIQKIYFYDSELKEYFEIPYRKLSAPVMTLWDLYAAKTYLKKQKIKNYNEDDIFAAYEELEKLEKKVKEKHLSQKTTLRQRKPRISAISYDKKEKEISLNSFESLFNNIEIYEIK